MDLKEALEYAVGLAEPRFHIDDRHREWSDKPLHPVECNPIEHIEVHKLSALADLLTDKINNIDPTVVLLHVITEHCVRLIDRVTDQWNRRAIHAVAINWESKSSRFNFDQFTDHESFLIGLLANFAMTPDRDYLVQLVTHVESGKTRTSLDDGVSQAITVKTGTSLKTEVAVRNRLVLAPFRTFREVEQPQSEFIFRLRGGSDVQTPNMALFEADGGRWRLDAMEAIGRYLRNVLKVEVPVVI